MFLIRIYDYLQEHRKLLWTSLIALTAVFAALVSRLGYNEDISDFLPLGTADSEALAVYQNISGANRIYVLFSNPDDADLTVQAIDQFQQTLADGPDADCFQDLTTQFDMDQVQEVASFVYDNIPYFLTDADFARMEQLLEQPDYARQQMQRNRDMLMFPTGGMMGISVTKDPLGLFAPILSSLQSSGSQMNFEMYDGYIFTPDMSRAVAMMSSPFGNSETENNTRMLAAMKQAAEQMSRDFPGVTADIVGGPEIAVGNSARIKKDSIIAISLSSVLIILLLVYSFASLRNILLILLSIGWGWLFAMGGMSLMGNHVSIIVIGISSVILGIAVNYPLHLIAHTAHEPRMRVAIKEIMMPLVVGNITTVGAFLALVPLQSTALRDLGLFASLLLVGTILFVLLYLPHFVKVSQTRERKSKVLDRMAAFCPEKHKPIVAAVVVLTAVLSVFSFGTQFDSNLSNINYMTKQQKADMQYFQDLLSQSVSRTTQSVYVLSSGSSYDEALEESASKAGLIQQVCGQGLAEGSHGAGQFLASRREQERRLQRWQQFVNDHGSQLTTELHRVAGEYGFNPRAFAAFDAVVAQAGSLEPKSVEYFQPLTQLVLSQNLTSLEQTGRDYVIDVLDVEPENIAAVKAIVPGSFDVAGVNSAMANNLSDNFNYIGWACSLIVFFFLWFSFGRLELAIISFLPMAISWVWILGIMTLLGIKFNIVNVILATFIFGQGDDYTIFMTEGCQHEYTYRRPILASYKSSILQSAMIMFVGIGTLIVARHPAMRSLAQVTIIGMFSVVLMAYMIPPLLFGWLTSRKGVTRIHPITIGTILHGVPKDPAKLVIGRYIYKGTDISRSVRRSLADARAQLDAMPAQQSYTINDSGYGEKAIYVALTHADAKVVAVMSDENRRRVAEISAKDFVTNIEFVNCQ